MKRKALALILCLAVILTVALPGTLAVSMDTQTTTSTVTLGSKSKTDPQPTTEPPATTEIAENTPQTPANQAESTNESTTQPTVPETTVPETTVPETTVPETTVPETSAPQCTCATTDGNHAEGCELYVEPEEIPEATAPVENNDGMNRKNITPFTKVAPLVSMDMPMTLDMNPRATAAPGVNLSKTAKANTDGSFTITLEAYVTGESVTVTKLKPADIVLVLDMSNSMRLPIDNSAYKPVYGNIGSGYGGTNYTNQDGMGNSSYNQYTIESGAVEYVSFNCTNAYSVEGHDASSYASNFRTYYTTDNNGNFIHLYYYSKDGAHNNSYGWFTYTNGRWNGPLIPKTSATDTDNNHVQFYIIDQNKTTFASLKNSANAFIDSVFETSPESSIAIVSYASSSNVESGFKSSDEATALKQSVNGLKMDPQNGTRTDLGLGHVPNLMNGLDDSHAEHSKVVVLFTDGSPTSSTGFEESVANEAISVSEEIKGGATVYTVGVFSGADATLNFTSFDGMENTYKFLHLVSSNYPNATSMNSPGNRNPNIPEGGYYLSAESAEQLNTIFLQISNQVGGATNETLGSSTVVKDIIAPSFTVPANASDIKLYTADCTGAGLTFGNRTPATGVTATITGNTLDVTGFNFSANWCGSHSGTYSGKKLIVEFTVSPKEGFLGGNDVPTNGDTSGLYSQDNAVGLFDVPTVNVPIKPITIDAADKNVYLTQVPGESDLKTGVTIKSGNVDITDPSKLEDWQKAYVTIESGLTTSDGFNATADGSYTVTVSVAPKTNPGDETKPGTVAVKQTSTETKNINVFKPELTFKDSTVYYGDNAPISYDGNLTKTEWKHNGTLDTDVTMTGEKPTLSLSYAPGTGIVDGKVATKNDIPVDVTVTIGTTNVNDKTTFVHTKCNTNETDPTDGMFWLHVKTCSLTITKAAGANTTIGNDEYFVFNIKKDGAAYTQVTIQGIGSVTISQLPVGTYTVEEDTATAWRYDSSMSASSATLSKSITSATVTCTNTIKNDKWLNHFARVINTFGKTN